MKYKYQFFNTTWQFAYYKCSELLSVITTINVIQIRKLWFIK